MNEAVKSRSRKPLLRTLEKKLLSYTAAAGAVCMAGLAPANAEVVYTPADIVASGGTLDLDGDGIADFSYVRSDYFRCGRNCSTSFYSYNSFLIKGLQTPNGVVPDNNPATRPRRLPAKDTVGSRDTFVQLAATSFRGGSSQWKPPARGYVGLKFIISGEVHYGWLRLTIDSTETVTIGGYAYETVPNKPIVVNKRPAQEFPVPGSLGSLAAGAQARLLGKHF